MARTTKKKKVEFNTHFNYVPEKGVIIDAPSDTIPDDTMSIQEMLYRHQNGTLIGFNDLNFYEEDDEIPLHLKPNFDLTDIDDAREDLELTIKDRQEQEEYEKWNQSQQESVQSEISSEQSQEDSSQTDNNEDSTNKT